MTSLKMSYQITSLKGVLVTWEVSLGSKPFPVLEQTTEDVNSNTQLDGDRSRTHTVRKSSIKDNSTKERFCNLRIEKQDPIL